MGEGGEEGRLILEAEVIMERTMGGYKDLDSVPKSEGGGGGPEIPSFKRSVGINVIGQRVV